MLKYNNLSDVQRQLLDRSIIDLSGDTEDSMAMYVREALMRLIAKGSPPITVIITSNGGSVSAALDIYDFLKSYPGTTTGLVIGFARSMAVIVLQACTKRIATTNALLLIHHISRRQISLDVLRSHKRLSKVRAEMEKSQARLYKILTDRTGHSLATIRRACATDRDMDTHEALSFRLIDEIVDAYSF